MNLDDMLDDERFGDNREKTDFKDTEILKQIDTLREQMENILNSAKDDFQHLEIEDERSNGDRSVYINRELVFSDRYIDAIKSLGEDRYCTRDILKSSRKMLDHHHGDKYEDLYFVDVVSHKVLSRIDYKTNKQEVLPTSAMKDMARNNPNIISIHNHPTDALPSYEDIKTCFLVGYKYGLVICHGGDIFQYRTLDNINKIMYESECSIYYKREYEIAEKYTQDKMTKEQFGIEHQKSFIKLAGHLIDAGVILKEVLWNGKPQKQRDDKANNE